MIIIILFVSQNICFDDNKKKPTYSIILGSIPSFDIVKEKNLQNISWYQMTHPIYCTAFGKIKINTSHRNGEK